jgi:uncharacterized membrane protein
LKHDSDSNLVLVSPDEPKTPRVAGPVVLPEPKVTDELKVPQAKPASRNVEAEVTVAPNLADLVTGKLETPEEAQAVERRHEINTVVHRVLIVGLMISTVLILIGLGLDLVRHRQVPSAAPTFREVFRRTAELRPSGFLTLGLLVLIATPIMRVIGSTFAFLYERDWRYALITFVVLVVVTLSLLLGQG